MKETAKKVRSEVDSIMTTVETSAQGAVLPAIEILMIPRMEPAMNSLTASSGRVADSVVMDPNQRDFSAIVKGLQMST